MTRDELLGELKKNLVAVANRMKQVVDRYRREVVFKKCDMVFLKLQPHRQSSVFKCAHQKLANRYFGPYKIIQRIGVVAYKTQLP